MEVGKKSSLSYKLNTRQIAVIGMLSSISIILGLTGYGFIPLPVAKATFMHVPVIIGAILEGPVVGAMIGLIFGVFSIFQNLANPNLLSFAFINPLVSVLPRILIGITSYYFYRLIAVRFKTLGIGIGAAVGSLTNTIGVLGMIYLLYAARYAEVKQIAVNTAAKVIFGVALTNGIPEAIIAIIITIPVVMAITRRK
ncbi:MAG: ECF transporter S component [Caulobacteraceae bacterium]